MKNQYITDLDFYNNRLFISTNSGIELLNINDNVPFSMTTYSGDEDGTVQGGWLPNKNMWLGIRYRSDF